MNKSACHVKNPKQTLLSVTSGYKIMDDLGLVLTLTHIQNGFYSQLTVKIPTTWAHTLTNDVLYDHKHTKHQIQQCLFNPVTTGLQYSIMQISQELHHVVTGNRLNTIPSFTRTQVKNRVPLTWCFSKSTAAIQTDMLCVFLHRHLPASPSLLTVLLCLYLRENER